MRNLISDQKFNQGNVHWNTKVNIFLLCNSQIHIYIVFAPEGTHTHTYAHACGTHMRHFLWWWRNKFIHHWHNLSGRQSSQFSHSTSRFSQKCTYNKREKLKFWSVCKVWSRFSKNCSYECTWIGNWA